MILKGVVIGKGVFVAGRGRLEIEHSFGVGTQVFIYLNNKFEPVKIVRVDDFGPPQLDYEDKGLVAEDEALDETRDWNVDVEG